MNCPNCSYENLADAKFCQNCGKPLEKGCPACATLNARSARFCKNCGSSLLTQPRPAAGNFLSAIQQRAPISLQEKVRASRASIQGERKEVTILFVDVLGSKALEDKLDPEQWAEIVAAAHRIVGDAVYRQEGTIAQLLGIGVFAFFGAPISHQDDPVRAVRAALEILHSVGEYARSLDGNQSNLQMPIGINTGMVVLGNIGSDLQMEYLAIDDSLDLAVRLQSAAKPGTVFLSEGTAQLLNGVYELKAAGEISANGNGKPVRIFQALDRWSATKSERDNEGLNSPFVGHEDDLQRLTDSLGALCQGHGQVVAVMGEAGIGKSRLVDEVRRRSRSAEEVPSESGRETQGEPVPNPVPPQGNVPVSSVRWLEARSLSCGQTFPFWGITQLLKADLGLADGEPEATIRVTLRRRLSSLFGERSSELMPLLSHLLGIRMEQEEAEKLRVLDRETLARKVLLAIADYFGKLAGQVPTVLVFEDLQWADPSTLQALERLLQLTDRWPVMLLILSRIEREHGSWRTKAIAATDYADRYVEIDLKPLSSEDSNCLIDNFLAFADVPDSLRQLILDRSEGNPFYLKEIIRSLIEQGDIVREGQTWHVIAEFAKPDSLRTALLARIDRLEEDERRTLRFASVIGRSFLYRLVEAITEAERELDTHMGRMQRADLAREKERDPDHLLNESSAQEAALYSQAIERRKEFHDRVGQALERILAEI